MSPELIAIIGVGIALLTVQISIAGLLVTLMLQSEKRANQRIDRLEDRITHELQLFRTEINQRFEHTETQTQQHFEHGETQTKQQFARQEDQTKQQFARQEDQAKQQFDALNERVRGLEQGQARLAAELSLLKDLFTHFLRPERE